MTTSTGATARLAEAALAERLRAISGKNLDRADRAPQIDDVVLESIPPEALQAALGDVGQGDGGELKQPPDETLFPRFHSARSSCALAVNAFAPWRLNLSTLRVQGIGDFTSLRFESKQRPAWLFDHLERLRSRYSIPLSGG